MIPTSLITIQNAIIIWNLYHYYVYADSIYKGVYYTGKILKTSKDIVEYVFVDNFSKHTPDIDLDSKNTIDIDLDSENDEEWIIINP